MMRNFEEELRAVLRRREPPEGLAERVADRLAARQARAHWWRRLAWALAAVVLLLGGFRYQQQRQERNRGEQAKQQLLTAIGITAGKLDLAQRKIEQFQLHW
jgi:hypothetical protein